VSVDVLKAGALVFVAALVQVSILAGYAPLGGTADLVLVVLLSRSCAAPCSAPPPALLLAC